MTIFDKSSNITRLKIETIIIPRNQHNFSRASISDYALKELYRLKNADYKAHLVGGGVCDILMGREIKDCDVATGAIVNRKGFSCF